MLQRFRARRTCCTFRNLDGRYRAGSLNRALMDEQIMKIKDGDDNIPGITVANFKSFKKKGGRGMGR